MTVKYRPKITSEYTTKQAILFCESFGVDTYYVSFGRSSDVWSSIENNANFKPPAPINSDWYKAQFYKDISYYTKINSQDVKLVIDRNIINKETADYVNATDWGDPDVENSKEFGVGDLVIANSIFGVNDDINAPNNGYEVFKCTAAPDSQPNYPSCPKYNVGGLTNIITLNVDPGLQLDDGSYPPDGYEWEYLYTIPPDQVDTYVTKDYIVVPTPNELNNNYANWGRDLINTTPFDVNNLAYHLNVKKVMIGAVLSDTDPIAIYRQIGLICNPWSYTLVTPETNDLESAASQSGWKINSVIASSPTYLPSEILNETGQIVYMENRPPITHTLGEVQDIRIIIGF
jgi:hypothetical protein